MVKNRIVLLSMMILLVMPSALASIILYDTGTGFNNSGTAGNGVDVNKTGWSVRTDVGSVPHYSNSADKDGSLVIEVDMSGATGEGFGTYEVGRNMATSCVAMDFKLGDTALGATEMEGFAFINNAIGDSWFYGEMYASALTSYDGGHTNWVLGTATTTLTDSGNPPNTEWNHYIFCSNATGMALYNNTLGELVGIHTTAVDNSFRDGLVFSVYQTNTDMYLDNIYWCDAFEDCTPSEETFVITAADRYDSTELSNLTVTISNSTMTLTNKTGSGSLTYTDISNGIYDITIASNQSGGYFNRTYANYNVSVNLVAELTPKYYIKNPAYSNNITYQSGNYVRNLSYSINYSCYSLDPASLFLYVNESLKETKSITCNNQTTLLTDDYIHSTEGNYSIYFIFNRSTYIQTTTNETFISDLNNPEITYLNLIVYEGFDNLNATIKLNCSDNIFLNLTYNLTYNGVNLFYDNLITGTYINITTLKSGSNTVIGKCSDLFGTGAETLIKSIYYTNLILIDEKDNSIFDLANCSSARVYFDSNSSYYDFKTENKTSVNFSSTIENKLRIELVYSDGGIITRYIDTELVSDNLRVCANKEGITHYPQFVISSSIREALVKNIFSNCFVAADYTRFAYQDAYSLKYYTIPSLYYLYTYDSTGSEVLLASIDGSISGGYNNIDTLEFTQQGYNINIQQDDLAFQRYTENSTWIYYYNMAQDNTDLSLTITRMDTNSVVFTKNDFTNQNNFTLLFDFTTLSGVNATTLFMAELIKTTPTGTDTIKRYFNTLGEASAFKSEFTFIIALILSVFGLTFTISRLVFSWFGAIMMIVSIGVLSMSPSNIYNNYLMVIDVVVLIYIIIVSQQKNYPTMV